MAEQTIQEKLNELKQKQDYVGDPFGANDLRTLIEGIEYAMSHGGDVSVAVTPVENGYKLTVTDSEGNTQEATVQNGGDAYEVYKSTVPQGQTPMSKTEWLASLKGADGADGLDGADAVNPFKGSYNSLADLIAAHTATEGDSAYVKDASPATTWSIYVYDANESTNGYWADSGTNADTTDVQTFASSQSLNGVYIKKANGEIESGTANILSENATNIKIDGNSRLVKFVGNGNTFMYGNTSIPLQSGKVYRFNVLNPNFDRSNVTSSYNVFEIAAYDQKDRTAPNVKQLVPVAVTNAYTVRNDYYVYLPTSYEANSETINVREWYVLIGGRANVGEEVRTLIFDYEEPINYFEYDAEYTTTGEIKFNTLQRFNLLKGHQYKLSIQDSNSQNVSYCLYDKDNSQMFNAIVVSNAASYTFTADKDYIGCYFRFYLASANTSFTAVIEDVSIKELQDTCEQLDDRVTALETDTPIEEETDSTIAVKDLTEGAVDFRAVKGGEPIASNNTAKRIPLSSGVTYTIKIWSNSGITSTAGTGSSYTIEIYRGQTGALYRLAKNSEFVERTLTITPSSDDYIYVPTARFENDEILYVAAINTSNYNVIIKGKQLLSEKEQNEVLGNLSGYAGYESTSFIVAANASHSSENNKIDISHAPKGSIITVMVNCKSGSPRSCQIYLFTSYGTNIGYAGVNNAKNTIKILKDDDYSTLGLYVASASGSVTYDFAATWSDISVIEDNKGDVVSCNKDAIDYIRAAKTRYFNDGEYSNYGNRGFDCYLAILQLTDTHIMNVSGTLFYADINRAFEFAKKTKLIDTIIHTGDVIEDPSMISRTNSENTPIPTSGYTSGKTKIKEVWKQRVTETEFPTLAIAGNHEFTTQYPLYDSEITELLYSDDIVTHVGETHGTGSNNERKNYFYKDITKTYTLETGTTKTLKLRIVGLYQFEWDVPRSANGAATYYETSKGKNHVYYTQEQIDWLVDLLENTPTDTPVVILSHYHLSACKYTDSVYNRPSKRSTLLKADDINSFMSANPYFFYQIINAWINGGSANGTFTLQQKPSDDPNGENTDNLLSVTTNFTGGGKFVANICGHTHSGGMMYFVDDNDVVQDGAAGTNKMPIIMSPCTTSRDKQNTGWWARESNNGRYNKLADCFNVIVYDDDADKVKVIRVGSTITGELENIQTYVF